jgi:pimeloyl-ACP methyl ester carboxylesterase
MEEKEILIDNSKVNYKTAGDGPAVLILHGWGGSSDSWVEFQEIVSKGGYRVIVLDLPGFGKSISPQEPWGINEYAEFILNFIKTAKNEFVEPFYLIGHSFGGRIAVKFSGLYPKKIKKLILCDSAGIRPAPNLKTRIIILAAEIGKTVFSPQCLQIFRSTARNLFYSFLRSRDYVKAKGPMRETMKKVIGEDLLKDLSGIEAQTLIVWGEKDKMVPRKYALAFKEKIKNSELIILPKIGHSPNLEDPQKLAEIVIKFLKN